MSNKKYTINILKIIFLTNLPILIIMPVLFKESIGWILGSVASAVNFYWMFRQVNQLNMYNPKASAKYAGAGFMFRYLFLVLWSIMVVLLIKPNIIMYGMGLLSAQIAIFLYQGYLFIKSGPWAKYYRGDQDE